MPTQLRYTYDGIGVEFITSGVVTGKDIIEANKEVVKNDNFLNLRYQIIDRINCTKFQVSSKEVKIIANQDKSAGKINPNIVIGIISKTDLQYGISRMYQAYVEKSGFLTHVFRDRKNAEEWIKNQLKGIKINI